jgi:hypothetical protein
VGGPIKSLEWDRTGERLAVTFSGDQEGAEVIALFATSLQPFLQLTPRHPPPPPITRVAPLSRLILVLCWCLRRGFIRGPKDGKKPDIVAFANRFPRGALLATCWRNGKISFCPRTPPLPSSSSSSSSSSLLLLTLPVRSLFPTPEQRGAAQVVRACASYELLSAPVLAARQANECMDQ